MKKSQAFKQSRSHASTVRHEAKRASKRKQAAKGKQTTKAGLRRFQLNTPKTKLKTWQGGVQRLKAVQAEHRLARSNAWFDRIFNMPRSFNNWEEAA